MATYPRYLAYLGLTVLGLLGLVVTINYQVDPYLIHQWDSPLLQLSLIHISEPTRPY